MTESAVQPVVLSTSTGEIPLHEYRLGIAGRTWSILHTGAVLSHADEARFLGEAATRLPYGVVLWPAAIALAHELAARGDALRGTHVLELGAGTGLPGIVAASLGARVVQTDRQDAAMAVCRGNGARNGAAEIEYRLVDWTEWSDEGRYEWIIGSDILYGESLHPQLRRIFQANLAPGGRILISDPFRAVSLRLLEAMEADGWRIAMTKWTVGAEDDARPIAVFEIATPE